MFIWLCGFSNPVIQFAGLGWQIWDSDWKTPASRQPWFIEGFSKDENYLWTLNFFWFWHWGEFLNDIKGWVENISLTFWESQNCGAINWTTPTSLHPSCWRSRSLREVRAGRWEDGGGWLVKHGRTVAPLCLYLCDGLQQYQSAITDQTSEM